MPDVLVVEDRAALRALCQFELEDAGFEVATAATGAEALDVLDRWACGVVVLDLRLPDMDGCRLLEQIRYAYPDTAVVIHTAHATYRDSFMSWAADAFLVKSSDFGPLVDAVRDAVSHHTHV